MWVCLFVNNNHPVDMWFHFIPSLKFLEIYTFFFCEFFFWNQWSNLPPDCDYHSLAQIRVLLHLWVGPIPYKIPKWTSQRIKGPQRTLLSIITCIYDCWQWTSQGEEAIRLAVALHKKIEEKAVPVRTWLVCHL